MPYTKLRPGSRRHQIAKREKKREKKKMKKKKKEASLCCPELGCLATYIGLCTMLRGDYKFCPKDSAKMVSVVVTTPERGGLVTRDLARPSILRISLG